jgi:hypothetical protein
MLDVGHAPDPVEHGLAEIVKRALIVKSRR